MKKLFKLYFNSVLNPKDFSEFSEFIGDKKNDLLINNYLTPFWEKEMNNTDVAPKQNPVLFKKINDAIWLERHNVVRRKIRNYTIALRVTAVFIVALVVSNIFFLKKSENNQLAEQLQTVTTPYGARTNITLPDGTLVWLNAGSTLSYPLKFSKTRPVTLVGEAFFEVVKKQEPFIVSTNYGEVEVKGTSFNVKAYADDKLFETTLVEGSVALKDKGDLNELVIKPGEQAINANNGFVVNQVDTKHITSWKEGKLLFNREPFPSFIKQLERWYNVKIEYTNPALNEILYSGTVESESANEVMQMISKVASVTYSFNAETRVFTINSK